MLPPFSSVKSDNGGSTVPQNAMLSFINSRKGDDLWWQCLFIYLFIYLLMACLTNPSVILYSVELRDD
jgi:hypothetical protein